MNRWANKYDESSVRQRPSRRGSRPRTKHRPAHDDAVTGVVTTVDRGRYTVLLHDTDTAVVAMRARELGRKSVVVGDHVGCVGDTSGQPGSLARIVKIHDRTTTLRRTADDSDPTERVIVANMAQMVIVTAAADPEPRLGMIDRCVVAAHVAGIDPIVCVTKTDLADPEPLVSYYDTTDVTCLTTSAVTDVATVAALRELLADHVSVLVGHSGVGKSTLVNSLVPDANRATGSVNEVTGRGRHTSSSAVMLPLPGSGMIVDTPGVRSFGLAHVPASDVLNAFTDLAPLTADCPHGCSHLGAECALSAHENTPTRGRRVTSLRALLINRHGNATF